MGEINTIINRDSNMNKRNVAILAATLVCAGSLAACQSTPTPKEPPNPMMDGSPNKPFMKRHHFTPEQRAEMQQRRAEREAQFAQIQQACTGKTIGQSVQVTLKDKTIDGTCELHFKPNPSNERLMAPPAPATTP